MHLRRGNGLALKDQRAGGAGIMRDDALETEVEGGASRGIDAHIGLHTANHHPIDLRGPQVIKQRRIAETVGIVFLKDDFAIERADVLVNLPADGAGQKRLRAGLDGDVLNVHDRLLRLPEMIE